MKTAQVQENQASTHTRAQGAGKGCEKGVKSLAKRAQNHTQVLTAQGFNFSHTTLGTCQELSARKPLHCNDFRFHTFHDPLYRYRAEKFGACRNAKGRRTALNSAGALPDLSRSAPRQDTEKAREPEHISEITPRVLEAMREVLGL